MKRLYNLAERLRTSLWFIPALFAGAALIGAAIMVAVDRQLQTDAAAFYLYGGSPEGARNILSTIAQSMLTFTGLVFTITMLVLQLASSQLSPRVLRTFLADRQNQVVLGLFVATFVYTLVIIRDVRGADAGEEFVPALSIWLSFVLLLTSVGAFVYYINHMAHAIRASTVIANIAQDAANAIERNFPDSEAAAQPGHSGSTSQPQAGEDTSEWVEVTAREAGYLQSMDESAVVRTAQAEDVVVMLVPRIGDFVTRHGTLFRVRPGGSGQDLGDALLKSVRLGRERTMNEDPAFGLRQLVDVGARALSPGTNDPTTATQVIDRLEDLLLLLASRNLPDRRWPDEEGAERLVMRTWSWADMVRLAFDELRVYGGGHLQVAAHLARSLHRLAARVPHERRPELERQLDLLRERISSADAAIRPELERAVRESLDGVDTP